MNKEELLEEAVKKVFEEVGLSVSFLENKKSDAEVEKEIEELFPLDNSKEE